MEDCEVFCNTIWDQFFESIPSLPLDQDAFQHICSNDVSGHKIYWLRCDAIMHHMIIEKSWGRYRIVKAYIGEYTGGDWCDMKTMDTMPWLNKNSFWKQFGGGRTIGMDEIRIPFDSTIHQIQKLIPVLTPHPYATGICLFLFLFLFLSQTLWPIFFSRGHHRPLPLYPEIPCHYKSFLPPTTQQAT